MLVPSLQGLFQFHQLHPPSPPPPTSFFSNPTNYSSAYYNISVTDSLATSSVIAVLHCSKNSIDYSNCNYISDQIYYCAFLATATATVVAGLHCSKYSIYYNSDQIYNSV